MKTKLMVLLLGSMITGRLTFAQHEHTKEGDKKIAMAMFRDAQLGSAYSHYIGLKDALVASNANEAKNNAIELQKALKNVSGSSTALEVSAKIAGQSELSNQRKLFSTLSNEMAALVKGGKLSMGLVYLEYCPMANNNTGAFWLSNDKEIKNPYFGDAMLKCGSVKETIH